MTTDQEQADARINSDAQIAWYYMKNGEQIGPVAESKMIDILHAGGISRDTLVWRFGAPEWTQLADFVEKVVA